MTPDCSCKRRSESGGGAGSRPSGRGPRNGHQGPREMERDRGWRAGDGFEGDCRGCRGCLAVQRPDWARNEEDPSTRNASRERISQRGPRSPVVVGASSPANAYDMEAVTFFGIAVRRIQRIATIGTIAPGFRAAVTRRISGRGIGSGQGRSTLIRWTPADPPTGKVPRRHDGSRPLHQRC